MNILLLLNLLVIVFGIVFYYLKYKNLNKKIFTMTVEQNELVHFLNKEVELKENSNKKILLELENLEKEKIALEKKLELLETEMLKITKESKEVEKTQIKKPTGGKVIKKK